ncbi:Glycerol dehydrogenase [Raoultella terrigena]|uniref:Glycerol dehydrogenase n=1 Tax=Raoultella terrigena TaxID=577 RepID=A0A4U9D8I0_RAOTE|nr:Glycerol dehydrogenase [Raoultella terrigena]
MIFTAQSSFPGRCGSTASGAIAGAEPFLPEAFSAPGAKKILFKGHCSESDVVRLVHEAGEDRSVVIGVGGGALLDTAKAVARRLALPVVAIPTIAATCAAWTPLSVWYNDAGQALHFEIFDDANFLVLVEPRIVLQRAGGVSAGGDRRYAGEMV